MIDRKLCFIDTIICLLFYSPLYIYQNPLLGGINTALKILLVVSFSFLVLKNSIKLCPITKSILVIFFIVSFATIINDDSLFFVIRRFHCIIGIALFIELRKKNLKGLYWAIFISSFVLISLNLCAMWMEPRGLYIGKENNAPYWFIGQKQDFASVFIPGVMASMLLWSEKKARYASLILYCVVIITLTQTMALGLFFTLLLIFVLRIFSIITDRRFSFHVLFMSYLILEALCIGIIFVADKYKSLWLYLDTLSAANDGIHTHTKADTIYSRLLMWKDGLNLILNNPFGNGYISEDRYKFIMKYSNFHPHIHNTFLDILMSGGFISIIAFVSIFVILIKMFNGIKTTQRDIYVYTIFSISILMLTEVPYWPFIWGIYILAYYYAKSYKGNKIKRNEISNLYRSRYW